MNSIPQEVEKLVKERESLRKQEKYEEGDAIREQIEGLGYEITDTEKGPHITRKEEYRRPKEFLLALFGSGEIAPSAVQVHRRVVQEIAKERPRIVVVSSPAGFQPNVQVVCEEIKDFFEKHLQNFHPQVDIIYANTREHANNPTLLAPLEKADYIFTGPGSPTYAVGVLRDSLLYQKIVERVKNGASLGLSSAGSIAFSKFCLPVYEIYKAGFDLYWEQGLNFYKDVFQELTVIPHFNNKEGGKKLDTSRAWMGKSRFEKLLALLPTGQQLWGIDEHTAVLINLNTKNIESLGKGIIHKL